MPVIRFAVYNELIETKLKIANCKLQVHRAANTINNEIILINQNIVSGRFFNLW